MIQNCVFSSRPKYDCAPKRVEALYTRSAHTQSAFLWHGEIIKHLTYVSFSNIIRVCPLAQNLSRTFPGLGKYSALKSLAFSDMTPGCPVTVGHQPV